MTTELKGQRTGAMIYNSKKIWMTLAGSFLLNLISACWVIGQRPECFAVHMDKSFYISGETIWFKIYLLNDSSEIKSRVLHVDLVTHQNETIARQKLLIDNRTSYGSITLPMDAKEGYYRFRAYTHYNLNFEPAYIFKENIPVYQPDKEDFLFSDRMNDGLNLSNETGVAIYTDNEIYKPRDSLTVTVQLNGSKDENREGNFSISVLALDIVNHEFQHYDYKSKCDDSSFNVDQLFDPERTLFIEGKLLDPESKRNVTSGLISIYMDETSQFLRASAQDGYIKAPAPDYWGTGIFQILNLDPYQSSVVEFIPKSKSKFDSPYFNPDQPSRTPNVLKYMELLKKRRKIMELFDLYQSSDINNTTVPARKPDAVYRTQDYQYIYSFEEFINEAIVNVKVRMINGEKSVRLFNQEMARLFTDHPWYIVDGYLTYNEKEVLGIQYQDILEIRLFTKTSTIKSYFEPFMWRNGILEIITRDVKYNRKLKNNPNVVEMEGFTIPQNFSSAIPLPQNNTTPDFRGVMYWSPNVFTDENGEARITIPLSDDTGKFAIRITGTTNSQTIVMGFATFEIKQ